ncbi:MAG: CAP domain-containing protein, partial [Oscillospiraceae bacterium]|nr:CAP domain-containing protein [Oscillospiraceae bacterium]
MNRIRKRIAAALTAAALAAGLAIPAGALDPSAGPIRVSSCKGNTLEAGERSLLIIGPAGAEYTASSGNPEAVAIERVMTYWVAVAKAEGTAEITVTDRAGDTGSLTLTVGTPKTDSVPASAPTSSPTANEDAGLTANMELRQETIRLINEIRRENG